jgi:hypothetical protein
MPTEKPSDLGRVEDATMQLAVNLANLEHGVLSPFQTRLLLSSDLNKALSNYQSASGRGVEYISKDVDRQILSLWASIDVLIAEITRLRESLSAPPAVRAVKGKRRAKRYRGRGRGAKKV